MVPAKALLPTVGPGTAGSIAAAACREGVETLVAAGGDGTVSEVADGMASVPGALEGVRLGVLPMGTVNVFARELALPVRLAEAWRVIGAGRETAIDLPLAEFGDGAGRRSRRFVQLAGCGLDSRAIAAVRWDWKRRVGTLAYAAAVAQSMRGPQPRVTLIADGRVLSGELVLVGNGRLYGGDVRAFPQASLRDGILDARVFARVTFFTLARFLYAWMRGQGLGASAAAFARSDRFTVEAEGPVPVEVDGDNVGVVPVQFRVCARALRVLIP